MVDDGTLHVGLGEGRAVCQRDVVAERLLCVSFVTTMMRIDVESEHHLLSFNKIQYVLRQISCEDLHFILISLPIDSERFADINHMPAWRFEVIVNVITNDFALLIFLSAHKLMNEQNASVTTSMGPSVLHTEILPPCAQYSRRDPCATTHATHHCRLEQLWLNALILPNGLPMPRVGCTGHAVQSADETSVAQETVELVCRCGEIKIYF